MLCADVNLLVDLANRGGRRHEAVRAWWEATQQSPEPVLVPDFLDRVLESPRVAMMSRAAVIDPAA